MGGGGFLGWCGEDEGEGMLLDAETDGGVDGAAFGGLDVAGAGGDEDGEGKADGEIEEANGHDTKDGEDKRLVARAAKPRVATAAARKAEERVTWRMSRGRPAKRAISGRRPSMMPKEMLPHSPGM